MLGTLGTTTEAPRHSGIPVAQRAARPEDLGVPRERCPAPGTERKDCCCPTSHPGGAGAAILPAAPWGSATTAVHLQEHPAAVEAPSGQHSAAEWHPGLAVRGAGGEDSTSSPQPAVGVRKGLSAFKSCMQKAEHTVTCNCFRFGCPEGCLETETESFKCTPHIKTNVNRFFPRRLLVCLFKFALMWHMSLEHLQQRATVWTTLSCNWIKVAQKKNTDNIMSLWVHMYA